MRKYRSYFYCNTVILLLTMFLVACSNNSSEESSNEPSDNTSVEVGSENDDSIDDNEDNNAPNEDSTSNYSDSQPENDAKNDNANETDTLSSYSSKEIEYARVWSQLGPNQDIDELNVQHIPSGSLINPEDETSANYPEDVIQLSGSRSVDGSVTYSGNGDGTINVYNVPLRWDNNETAEVDENFMQEFTEEIIEDTELVQIDTGNDERVIELINKLSNQ